MTESSATLKYDLLSTTDALTTQVHVILPMPSQPCGLSVHWISAEYFRDYFQILHKSVFTITCTQWIQWHNDGSCHCHSI